MGRSDLAVLEREDLVLRPYQQGMRAFARARPFCALWADMGLGKTPTTLSVMADTLWDDLSIGRWLVVGPRLVVEDTWPQHLSRWRQFAKMRWRLLSFDDLDLTAGKDADTGRRTGLQFRGRTDKHFAKRRLQAMDEPVHLVSWDLLPWLVKAYGANWPYDGMVLDEAVFAQNSTSGRHKAVWQVAHRLKKVKRMIQLTGAPTPNGYEMLHGQMRLLDGGVALGETKTDFRVSWLAPTKVDKSTGRVWSWGLAPGAKGRIDAALQPLVTSLATEDYLQLPPVVINPVWVDLPPAARRVYAEMESELVAQVGDTEILAASQGVLCSKLLQIANGALYDNNKVSHVVHHAKMDRLAELLEAEPGQVLLAFGYKHDWLAIAKRFKFARHVNDAGALAAFRRGECKLLGLHPASGGHGLDGLQQAGSCVIWYGATYNADHWLQTNKRIHRDGQRAGRVVVHQLLARQTIEAYVAGKAISEKLSEQEHLLKALMMQVSSAAHGTPIARTAVPGFG